MYGKERRISWVGPCHDELEENAPERADGDVVANGDSVRRFGVRNDDRFDVVRAPMNEVVRRFDGVHDVRGRRVWDVGKC